MKRLLFLLLILVICVSLSNAVSHYNTPWVYRGNIENLTKRIVISLTDEALAIFNPEQAALESVLDGSLRFENSHGFKGNSTDLVVSDHLYQETRTDTWQILKNGDNILKSIQFKGYEFVDEYSNVVFKYELLSTSNSRIDVSEKIEMNQGTLIRGFSVNGLQPGEKLKLLLSSSEELKYTSSGGTELQEMQVLTDGTVSISSSINVPGNAVARGWSDYAFEEKQLNSMDFDMDDRSDINAIEFDFNSLDLKVGGLDVFSNGDLALAAWGPYGGVYRLKFSEDQTFCTLKQMATGLHEPLGIKVIHDTVYVLEKQQLTRLKDRNGDGKADYYENINDDWMPILNYHQYAFGLAYSQGHLFAALGKRHGTSLAPQPKNTDFTGAHSGTVLKLPLEPGPMEIYASGLRNPNGINANGEMILVTDNQGEYRPACPVFDVQNGINMGFKGRYEESFVPPFLDQEVTLPAIWIPHGRESKSCAEPFPITSGIYTDDWLVTDASQERLNRISLERVDGVLQGAVYNYAGDFYGSNRIQELPNGKLVIGSIGSNGWRSQTKGFLRILEQKAEPIFEISSVSLQGVDKFRMRFSQDLPENIEGIKNSIDVEQRKYAMVGKYGGGIGDKDNLNVVDVQKTGDNEIEITVQGLAAERVVAIEGNFTSSSGNTISSPFDQVYYTVNKLGVGTISVKKIPETGSLIVSRFEQNWFYWQSPDKVRRISLFDLKGQEILNRSLNASKSGKLLLPAGNKGILLAYFVHENGEVSREKIRRF